MKKSRFSESQIVAILKEVELGAKVGETCRKHGISETRGRHFDQYLAAGLAPQPEPTCGGQAQ